MLWKLAGIFKQQIDLKWTGNVNIDAPNRLPKLEVQLQKPYLKTLWGVTKLDSCISTKHGSSLKWYWGSMLKRKVVCGEWGKTTLIRRPLLAWGILQLFWPLICFTDHDFGLRNFVSLFSVRVLKLHIQNQFLHE